MGKELRIKRGGDIYEMFRYGDAVVPKHMTDNLFTLADHTNEVMETTSKELKKDARYMGITRTL